MHKMTNLCISTFLVQNSHFFGTYYDFWDTLYVFLKHISMDLFWPKTHENTSPVTLRKTGGNRDLKEELFGPFESDRDAVSIPEGNLVSSAAISKH